GVCFCQFFLLARWHLCIAHGDGDTGFGSIGKTKTLDLIGQFNRPGTTVLLEAIRDNLSEVLLFHWRVLEAQQLWQSLVEDDTPDSRFNQLAVGSHGWRSRRRIVINVHITQADLDGCLQVNHAMLVCQQSLRWVRKDTPFALLAWPILRQVEAAEHH